LRYYPDFISASHQNIFRSGRISFPFSQFYPALKLSGSLALVSIID